MTQQQRQHLLAYLGYYSAEVDGIWGPKSEAAAEQFRQDWKITETGFGPETEEKLRQAVADDRVAADWWQDIRYWKREEFRCRCGGKYCTGYPAEPQQRLVKLADQVREHFGRPGYASSGLRCRQHNANCGGVQNSRHLTGKALDFCISGIPAEQTLAFLRTLSGVRYAYAIDGSYVHMDTE